MFYIELYPIYNICIYVNRVLMDILLTPEDVLLLNMSFITCMKTPCYSNFDGREV
jgi:hypothetical protein